MFLFWELWHILWKFQCLTFMAKEVRQKMARNVSTCSLHQKLDTILKYFVMHKVQMHAYAWSHLDYCLCFCRGFSTLDTLHIWGSWSIFLYKRTNHTDLRMTGTGHKSTIHVLKYNSALQNMTVRIKILNKWICCFLACFYWRKRNLFVCCIQVIFLIEWIFNLISVIFV